MTTHASVHEGRLAAVRRHDPEAAALVEGLLVLAPRGLAASRSAAGGFAQTLRGRSTPSGPAVRAEGHNPRYAAMAALGLARLPAGTQQRVLAGGTVETLLRHTLGEAVDGEPGALALTAWAEAEVGGRAAEPALDLLHRAVRSREPIATVAAAWAVTAGVAAGHLGDTTGLVADGCARLLRHRGGHGIFPHVLNDDGRRGLRGHVGSFADQVYPLQALARAGAATRDAALLGTADETASLLCQHQGPAGQWAWHYDARTGDVVERYPVYSVHQHAMAPMVLFDLTDAGGADHSDAVARGLAWLLHHPEVTGELVTPELGVVWRKVGRRERAKAARRVAAVTTAVRPGWRPPGIDRLLPPTRIDRECRPYELGWLLYAWLSPPGAEPEAPPAAASEVMTR
jgi:hypothetical protein